MAPSCSFMGAEKLQKHNVDVSIVFLLLRHSWGGGDGVGACIAVASAQLVGVFKVCDCT